MTLLDTLNALYEASVWYVCIMATWLACDKIFNEK